MAPQTVEIIYADRYDHKDRSARGRIAEWIRLRATEPGISNKEVARRMGISPRTLGTIIYNASKEGWLKFDDPLEKVEYQIIPKVTRNLIKFLDEGNEKVTIETAKGTLFKLYQDSKGLNETSAQTVLALKIELPTTPTGEVVEGEVLPIKAITGEIVGIPKQIED